MKTPISELEYGRRWRKEHPDYFKRYAANPEKAARIRELGRLRYRKNKDKVPSRYATDPVYRQAQIERSRKWRRENTARRAELAVKHARIRRDRERANGGRLSPGLRQRLMEQQGGRCAICQQTGLRLERDHVVPVVLGGPNVDDNIQLVCAPCNATKGKRVLE